MNISLAQSHKRMSFNTFAYLPIRRRFRDGRGVYPWNVGLNQLLQASPKPCINGATIFSCCLLFPTWIDKNFDQSRSYQGQREVVQRQDVIVTHSGLPMDRRSLDDDHTCRLHNGNSPWHHSFVHEQLMQPVAATFYLLLRSGSS